MIFYCIEQPKLQTTSYRILQGDLNADHWLTEFNNPKCKIMQITTHHNKSNLHTRCAIYP